MKLPVVPTGTSCGANRTAIRVKEMLPGCKNCTDFTSDFADLSAGKIGSKEGYTTLIVRNESGKALL